MPEEFDPNHKLHLDRLQEEYYRRHGAAMELIKSRVGVGEEYANEAGRVIISASGAWFECFDLPMEFSGAAGGRVSYRLIDDAEAMRVLDGLFSLANGKTVTAAPFGLFVLYSCKGISDTRDVQVY